jgi:hypothetical protein
MNRCRRRQGYGVPGNRESERNHFMRSIARCCAPQLWSCLIRRSYQDKTDAPTHVRLPPRDSLNSESFRERVVEAFATADSSSGELEAPKALTHELSLI